MTHKLPFKIKFRPAAAGLVLLVLDSLFFSMTNPNKVPSVMLIVGFLLVALSLYALLRLLLAGLSFYGLPVRSHGKRVALLLAISGSLAIALQSLGELTARDVLVLGLLSIIAYVYTSYGRGPSQK